MRWPVAALLLGTILAGCTQPPEAVPPVLKVLPEVYADAKLEELHFYASDGTYVHGTVYLPTEPRHGAQADRFGTIVNFSPYYGNAYGIETHQRLDAVKAGHRNFNQTGTGLLLAHGFAYVAASVPGTGMSGGCFGLGGTKEQTVMAEFIDWVGVQPWSNGNVGMAGGSYDGTTQWMAAVHAPEHLRTIVPHVSITDFYNYEYQDGAPYAWWGPYFLPYYLLLVGWGLDPVDGAAGVNARPGLLMEDLCPDVKDHFVQAEKTYATGVYDDFWSERNYAKDLGNLKASVLLVHGLQDWNVKPLHLDVWDQIPTEKAFWLGQMQHDNPWRNSVNEDWSRPDYNATVLAWYDHYLNGADNGVPGKLPAVWTQDHLGQWRTHSQWPPAEAMDTVYNLGAASLAREPVASGQTVFMTPPSYAGFLVEPNVGLGGPDAPDQVVAKFLTPQLDEPLRIAGTPRLELDLSVDRAGYSHIVAILWRIDAEGDWETLTMGGRGLAQREDRTRDDAVVPMEMMRVPVAFNPVDAHLEAGDQLALTLAGDDTDWFHPNGNTPTFFVEHGSTLTLPVLGADVPDGVSTKEAADSNPYYQADPKVF